MNDVATIAAGLSEDERAVFLYAPATTRWFIFTDWPDHFHIAMQRLQRRDLFDWNPHWNARWNETGLAVRQHLMEQDNG